jgi:exosortase A
MCNGEKAVLADREKVCRRWRTPLVVLVALLLAELLFYRETAMAMVAIWARSDTFMHGFLILPISLWLIWREREVLADMQPTPNPWFVFGIALSGFAWLLGQIVTVAPVSQFALIGILVMTVAAVLGPRISLAMGFPLAFLLFAVPFGEFFLPQLMRWTADFTVLGLRLTGIPVYREGLQFVIPSGSWSVAEACSGIRYLIASLMLGTLFAYLNYRSLGRRLAFIAVSFVVPILANWLRAYLIVMLGHFSGNKLAVGVDHLIYGWLFFGIVILLMFQIGLHWREDEGAESISSPEEIRLNGNKHRSALPVAVLASVVLAALWPFLEWHIEQNMKPDVTRLETLVTIPGWTSGAEKLPDWTPQFTAASAFLRQSYTKNGQAVGLFLAYYRNQSEGRKLVSSDNALMKSSDHYWKKTAGGTWMADIGGTSFSVKTGELRSATDDRLSIWQWYWINGQWTSNDYLAKAYTALYRLLGQGDDSAVVIVYTDGEGTSDPNVVLQDFVDTAAPAIGNILQRTGQGHE